MKRIPLRRLIIGIVAIVFVGLAATGYIVWKSKSEQKNTADVVSSKPAFVCDKKLIESANPIIRDNDLTGYEKLVGTIKAKAGYERDVNCQYIVARYSLAVADVATTEASIAAIRKQQSKITTITAKLLSRLHLAQMNLIESLRPCSKTKNAAKKMRVRIQRFMTNSKIIVARFSFVFVALTALLGLVVVSTVDVRPAQAAAKSKGQIQNALENGISTAAAWDQQCRSFLYSRGSGFADVRGATFNNNLRSYMNSSSAFNYAYNPSGATYKKSTWISQFGKGNTQTPISINEGTTSIDFQVNAVTFLCRSMISPDLTAGCSQKNVSGARIYNGQDYNGTNRGNYWVTSTLIKERPPNPVGNDCMAPAYTGQARQLVTVAVYENGSLKKNINIGKMIRWQRDNNSRYWLANPVKFTYSRTGGFTSDVDLKFVLTYKNIDLVRDPVDFVYYKPAASTYTIYNTGKSIGSITNADLNARWSQVRTATDNYYLSVNVIPAYSLTPELTLNPPTQVNKDSSITPSPKIISSANAGSHRWTLVRATFAPGKPIVYNPVTNGSACSVALAAADFCTAHDFDTQDFNAGSYNLRGNPYAIPSGMPEDTNVCFVLAVRQPTQSSTASDWRYSPLRCVKVVPAPEIATTQIWGYDALIGGQATAINRVYSSTPEKTQGSWGEYGVRSNGKNDGLASAAGLNEGNTTPGQAGWSKLTFANVDTDSICGSYGCFAGAPPNADALVAALKARCATYTVGSQNIAAFTTGGVRYICSHDTIRINGDITLANAPVSDIANLPQVVIIGRDIIIDKSVKRIDAWLIASPEGGSGGNISTCVQATNPEGVFAEFSGDLQLRDLTASTCPEPLTVNGPVISDKLYLYRTNPTDVNGVSAERFNLRADSFLWAYGGGGAGSPVASTVSIRELPPRF